LGDSPASGFYVPKRDGVTGDGIELHNEELHDLYSLPTIVRGDEIEKNEIGGTCSADGVRRGVYRVLVENPVVKRPLGSPRRRWEDNIKADLQEVDVEIFTGLRWLRIGTGGVHL
jgi:hypothetical protein